MGSLSSVYLGKQYSVLPHQYPSPTSVSNTKSFTVAGRPLGDSPADIKIFLLQPIAQPSLRVYPGTTNMARHARDWVLYVDEA